MKDQIINKLKDRVKEVENAAEVVSAAVRELDDSLVNDIKNGTPMERATAFVTAARDVDDRAKESLGWRPSAKILKGAVRMAIMRAV